MISVFPLVLIDFNLLCMTQMDKHYFCLRKLKVYIKQTKQNGIVMRRCLCNALSCHNFSNQ